MTFVAFYGPGAAAQVATQTASVTVATGDVLLLWAGTGSGTSLPATPTGGGLTWTTIADPNTARSSSSTNLLLFSATAASSQTFTCSVTSTGTTAWTWQALRFSGVTVGTAVSTAISATAPSQAITTTTANSAVLLAVDDWNAVSGASRTYNTATAGAFTETFYGQAGTTLTAYAGYYASAGAAGSKTIGLTAPTGQKSAIVAVELVPSGGATLNKVKVGANTVNLRVGATAASKAYVGATQVWP